VVLVSEPAGQRTWPPRLASVEIRNFRLFLIGQLVSSIGTWMHQVAEVWLTLQITDSGLAVGIVVASRFVPVLLLSMWGGALADRHSKRAILYVTQSVRGVAALALGVLALADHASVAAIVALALLGGAANAIDNPVRRAFIGDLVDDRRILNAVSLNSTVMATSRVIGPLLAGLFIGVLGVGWVFVLNGVSYLAVLVALKAMTLTPRQAAVRVAGEDAPSGSVVEGLRYAAGHRQIWLPLVMVGLVSASAWNWETLVVLHATRTFEGGSTLFTVMFAVLSVGTFVGALSNAGRSEVNERSLVTTAAAVGVVMLAMAVAPGLPLAFVLLGAAGVAVSMFNTASNALLQRNARGEFHGRVMAVFSALFVGSKGVGGAVAGAIGGTWGPRAGIAVGGFGCLAAVWVGRLWGSERAVSEVLT
jgi:MFS family permease